MPRVHEGQYVAEVEVEVLDTDTGWSPYLSVEDAYKLDDVRSALRRGDLKAAEEMYKKSLAMFKLLGNKAMIGKTQSLMEELEKLKKKE